MSIESLRINDFDAIKLKVASAEDIKAWSHGEVTRPETINYRTQKPEKDGLFCEKIFGPSKDWECYCGKYKKIRYKGIVCDKCGVEVTRAIVRRQRMGHIDLAVPVSHIWFLRGIPSKVGLILDQSIQRLEKVIYFANFIVTEVDESLKNEALESLRKEYVSKQKGFDSQLNQKTANIESGKDYNSTEKKELLKKAGEEIAEQKSELETDFIEAEKELKELRPMKIISEVEYHDLSLKYGHVFTAEIGAEAIRHLLEKVNVDLLISEMEKENFDDQGGKKKKMVNRMKLLKSLKRNHIHPADMILTALPVIPPDLRPMVPLDGGRYATSDLNDLYRRVISRNNRLKRLLELNAPEVIIRNEKRMLQEAVDALIDNSARHSKTTTASTGQKRKLKSIADYLKGKRGRFRQNLLGKRIDYSGRSVIVVGPELRLHQCGLPKKMALELFRPFVISELIKKEFVHNIRSANRFIESDRAEVWDILEKIIADAHVLLNRAPTLHRLGIQAFQPVLIEGKAIQLHPLVCSAFNADFDGDQMAVHVPLTEEAKYEAKNLMLSSKNLLKPATGNSIVTPTMDMVWGSYHVTSLLPNEENKTIKHFSSIKEAKIAYDLRKIGLRQTIKIRLTENDFDGKVKPGIFETSVGRILFNDLLPAKLPYYNETVDKKKMAVIVQLCLEYYGFETTAEVLDKIKDFGFKQLTKAGYSWGMEDLPNVSGKEEMLERGLKEVEEVQNQYEEGLLTNDERYSKVIEIWTKVKDDVTKLSQKVLPSFGPVFSMINSGARGSWGQLAQMLGMKGLVTNPAGQIIELPVKANFKEGFSTLEYYISTHGTRKGLSDTALRTANAGYLTRRLVDVAQDIVIREDDCGDTVGRVITKEESDKMGLNFVDRVIGRHVIDEVKDEETGEVYVSSGELITEEVARKMEKGKIKSIKIRSLLTCKLVHGVCKKCYGFDLAYNKPVETGTAVGIIAAQSIGEPGTQLTMRTFHTGGVAGGGDITQGLPRVEEVFEARPPKKRAMLAEVGGVVSIEEQARTISGPKGVFVAKTSFGQRVLKISYDDLSEKNFLIPEGAKVKVKENEFVKEGEVLFISSEKVKTKAPFSGQVFLSGNNLRVFNDSQKSKEYLIPPGTVLWVKDGDVVEKGAQLTEGHIELNQLYRLRGRNAVQEYVLKEIQYIYSSQGQKLNDKHIEIIARQMFSRVYITDSGDTSLLEGEIVEKSALETANASLLPGEKPAQAEEIFLGISKVSLSTNSFLSASSFQETAKVLINAAVTGRIDHLQGLKENVIIGRLIPAGTGYAAYLAKENNVENENSENQTAEEKSE